MKATTVTHSSLAALLALAGGCASGEPDPVASNDPASTTTEVTEALSSASLAHTHAHWRKAMSRMALPGEGCFQATHPSTTWKQVPCVTPPNVPFIPATGGSHRPTGGAETVGAGVDGSAQVSGTITWAEGSFPNVTGVTNTSTNYSLQINSNTFSGSPMCSGAANPSSCLGWEQFVYAPSSAFIQYWLINYGKACPSGWNQHVDPLGTIDCFKNSPSGVSVPAQPATNLNNIALVGSAGNGGDSISMSVAGTIYTYGTKTDVLNLRAHWDTAEFNIFGNANGTQFNFNAGSSVVVQTLTDATPATTAAPTCLSTGTTGETNNLTLVGCCPIGGSTQGIQFLESNVSPLPGAPACPLMAGSPNYSLVGHPFDGVIAGADVGGTPLFSCRANFNGGVHPGKTRANWSFCDISFGGQEVTIQPYETLVPAWTDGANGSVPADAFPFGTDGSGGPTLYPCRAYVNGQGFQVGKVRPGLGCVIPLFNQEVVVATYQVLTSSLPLTAQTVNSAVAPANSIIGGYDLDGTPLHVCQALFGGGLVPGKTRTPWTSCDVSYAGAEHFVSSYNVLIPTFKAATNVFAAGSESNGNVLGVCQASYQNSTQVGKYLTSGLCAFPFGGMEIGVTAGPHVLSF